MELKIKDVSVNETRTGFLKVIKDMGANFEIENQRIISNLIKAKEACRLI